MAFEASEGDPRSGRSSPSRERSLSLSSRGSTPSNTPRKEEARRIASPATSQRRQTETPERVKQQQQQQQGSARAPSAKIKEKSRAKSPRPRSPPPLEAKAGSISIDSEISAAQIEKDVMADITDGRWKDVSSQIFFKYYSHKWQCGW